MSEALQEAQARINHFASGLVLPCIKCGAKVPFDYVVENDFWASIDMPDEWKPNVLCLPCLDELATAQGKSVHEALLLVYFTGKANTSVLIPNTILTGERC